MIIGTQNREYKQLLNLKIKQKVYNKHYRYNTVSSTHKRHTATRHTTHCSAVTGLDDSNPTDPSFWGELPPATTATEGLPTPGPHAAANTWLLLIGWMASEWFLIGWKASMCLFNGWSVERASWMDFPLIDWQGVNDCEIKCLLVVCEKVPFNMPDVHDTLLDVQHLNFMVLFFGAFVRFRVNRALYIITNSIGTRLKKSDWSYSCRNFSQVSNHSKYELLNQIPYKLDKSSSR